VTEQLPAGWAQATLGDIAETRLGKMLSAKARVGTSPRPYLRNRNVQWGRIDISDLVEMGFADDEIERFTVLPGDVLVCEGGEVGRTAIWKGHLPWVGYQKALHRIRPAQGVSSEYLAYFMRWFASVQAFEPYVTGSTIKHLPQEDLRLLPVPVPPEQEQRRIVAVIEEQFSRLDAAERMLADVRRRLRQLRSVVLSSLLGGPWPLARMGDVASVGGGSTPKRDHAGYWENGTIPWVTSGQLTEPFVREPAALITEMALRETSVKLWPKHTLLVALYGEGRTRGHCSELLIDATTNQACAAILLKDDSVDRAYLKLFFAASYDAHRRLASGGVQPNLSLGLIKNLKFPLPPIETQQRIVAETEQRLSLADALAEEVNRALGQSITLRRSILTQAFNGRLVTQDASDEPAYALLKRIAAARKSEPKVSRRRMRVLA
jgi:type I restriction enzyme S subunit